MTPRTLREAVQDMKPLDALEYALTAYEDIAGEESAATAAGRRTGLSPVQGLMFLAMQQRMGQVVTLEALASIQQSAREGEEPAGDGVTRTQISYMRDRLLGRFTITSVRGQGYMMEPCSPRTPPRCKPEPSA